MVELTDSSLRELKSFYNMIQLSEGTFSICIVIANHPEIIEQVTTKLVNEKKSCRINLSENSENVLCEIVNGVEKMPDCQSIMITGLNELIRESNWEQQGEKIIFQINRTRDSWKAELPDAPIILWVNDFIYDRLASRAHDFWSWVSHTFELEAIPTTSTSSIQEIKHLQFQENKLLTKEDKQIRIAELKNRLQSAPSELNLSIAKTYHRWQLELADILVASGKIDEAWNLLQEIAPHIKHPRLLAITHGQIADILQDRGKLDQALEIREKKQLPVFLELGDGREAAITHGQIADILQARGKLDQALEIREKKELPVFLQLGDVREAAITHGQIADILQARGKLDQALEIREKKQLPVYLQLGDVRSAAITHGKIADILQARGKLDQALEIREKKELPVYLELGDVRSAAITHGQIAQVLIKKGNKELAKTHLTEAYHAAKSMQIPEAEQIAKIAQDAGITID